MADSEKEQRIENPRKSSHQGTGKGAAIWMLMLFLVSGWMFFLGVLVGRGTAPLRYDIEAIEKRLAAAKEAAFKRDVKRFQIPAEKEEGKADLGFYEALKESKESAQKKSQDVTIKETKPPGIPQKKEKLAANSDAATVQLGEAADKPGPGEKGKEPPLSVENEKALTLQIASFYSRQDAQRLVQELKDRGYPAYWTLGLIPGKGIWHRVRVGGFGSREEAGKMMMQLKKERYTAVIVNNQSQ
ncbi:MAG: SPOR domain-containing protein [Pseudomonadota bacterium]